MNILSNRHFDDMIRAWEREDYAHIAELIQNKKWYDVMLIKYAFNPSIRAEMLEIHKTLIDLIKQEKAEYFKNYGETYNILPPGSQKTS